MSIPDLINGLFESCGGLFILRSILLLHKSKKVSGISALHVAFFASWGFWNLFYYSNLQQWVSFYGGLGVVLTNTYWLGQIVYYLCRERRQEPLGVGWIRSTRYPGYEEAYINGQLHTRKVELQPTLCTRTPGHSGPCNGYCCHSQN